MNVRKQRQERRLLLFAGGFFAWCSSEARPGVPPVPPCCPPHNTGIIQMDSVLGSSMPLALFLFEACWKNATVEESGQPMSAY